MTGYFGAAGHSGQPGRRYNGHRGVRGRIHIPGSTRLLIATDGSWKIPKDGCGYVSRNGYWALAGRHIAGPRQLNPIPVAGVGGLVAELRAVGMALEHFPGRKISFLIDSETAISYLRYWQVGDVARMPSGYSLRPRIGGSLPALMRIAGVVAASEGLRFTHVRSHAGHVLNEVADSLAKIGRIAHGGVLGDEMQVADRATRLVSAFLGDGS